MILYLFVFFFKQKTAYERRISDWSSDVCSSDLLEADDRPLRLPGGGRAVSGRIDGKRKAFEAAPAITDAEMGKAVDQGGARLFIAALEDEAEQPAGAGEITLPQGMARADRQSVVEGKGGAVRVDLGGHRIIKKKKTTQ